MKAQQSKKLVFWYKLGPSKSHTTTLSHHIIQETMIIWRAESKITSNSFVIWALSFKAILYTSLPFLL
jgi:hypothetical protein